MPKEFLTERDIEDMVKRGILSLELNDQVVLTDLAYEKANRLGMRLVRDRPDAPPAAPVRPYIAQQFARPATPAVSPASPPAFAAPVTAGAAQTVPPAQADGEAVHDRIRNAVIARLGSQVDANLVDVIITRVLQNTGVK
ncbi:hypothetical protein LARV_03531 [Longilinea arvoryzae]|uniref:Uncharacterized protein n=1 Tax=Longilinea arvoryzae TaxID=360412 RepID=A0A0S7BNT5_9CHLR|nr:hypothetical protein [Longilinea arvoryzae]GAP15739.1 hypothetical protein LARV_03531 [Longilinea arvoryzae]